MPGVKSKDSNTLGGGGGGFKSIIALIVRGQSQNTYLVNIFRINILGHTES